MIRVKKIWMFECPNCNGLHEGEKDAMDCCTKEVEKIELFKCGECDETYEDREDAKECCKE